ncbi:MAG: 6-phospho-beta-glucosidase [Oscillospiraceae bacterium]|nr:6-phospho-beta-glucosidase [Oscillospiraceae bacterium]
MKLVVIGGGGVRSMFLAKSLVQRARVCNIREIVFMDTDIEQLGIYSKMARQVAAQIDPSVKFWLTPDAKAAVTDADYIITTIRVGGNEARVGDERIALSHGVLGQETTGAAGFSYAMRSVPVLVEYCELIRCYSKPGVVMLNFTNPAGVVSQTLLDLGYDFALGVCDAPSGLLHDIARLYGAAPDDVVGRCFGLNHLSFFDSVQIEGKERLRELIEDDWLYTHTEMKHFDKDLVQRMGLLLNEYLYYYFYPEVAINNVLAAGVTRGEVIRDINIGMNKELSGMDIEKDFERCLAVFEKWYGKREAAYMQGETGKAPHKPPFKFDINSKAVGGYAGVALKYIEAVQSGKAAKMILCVRGNGALPGLLDTDVVEVSCTIAGSGFTTDKFARIDEIPMELIRRVKMYERLASRAIRKKSKSVAVDCLMMHPLVGSYSRAKSLCEAYLEHNKDYTVDWT